MRRSAYFGVALTGLLVVAAISVAAGSGRKPSEDVKVSMRHVSTSEAMEILRKFPDVVPDYLASRKNDAEHMAGMFGFVEVTSAPLARVFPTVRFYKGHDFAKPPRPNMMAIAGDKRYMMPGRFNHLLLDGGQKVTDKNIIELAKAFVISAIGGERRSFPEVAFLDAKRTRQVINTVPYSAVLKVRVGAQTEEWYFAPLRGQLDVINRRNAEGLIKEYTPVAVEALPGHGQLYPTPSMVIDTFPTNGDAYLERDTANDPHYYVTVDSNGYAT